MGLSSEAHVFDTSLSRTEEQKRKAQTKGTASKSCGKKSLQKGIVEEAQGLLKGGRTVDERRKRGRFCNQISVEQCLDTSSRLAPFSKRRIAC